MTLPPCMDSNLPTSPTTCYIIHSIFFKEYFDKSMFELHSFAILCILTNIKMIGDQQLFYYKKKIQVFLILIYTKHEFMN